MANRETGSVHAIDIRSRTLTATMKVVRDAAHLALDTAANTVVATVDVGGKPQGIAVDPRTQNVYATDSERGTVIVLAGRR
ncbi:YncE family protein [Nocardia salmonicida]|uniref:YncE family protein n=1 Tax=Nocardia salmonicida TaxID=53431 RepID=UPI0007A44DFA|nr:hypothetical protein [Nocardia salmonicida]